MASPDRSSLRRRLAWFAGSLVVLALAALAFWLSRPTPPAPTPAAPIAEPAPAPPPLARPELGIADLVAAVSAALRPPYAEPLPGPPPKPIVGQRFSVVLPFGCGGPAPADSDAPLRWTFDPAQNAITLIAQPQSFTDTDLLQAIAPSGAYEAVEGFWIHPRSECAPPAAAEEAAQSKEADEPEPKPPAKRRAPEATEEEAPAPPPEPRIALATFFAPNAPRTAQRRDRAYRVTRKLTDPTRRFEQGFRLVLSGRAAALEEGPAIRCWAPPDGGAAPQCLIAVALERVAFQDAATGEILAGWPF